MRNYVIAAAVIVVAVVFGGAAMQAMGQDPEQATGATTTEPAPTLEAATTTDRSAGTGEPAATSTGQAAEPASEPAADEEPAPAEAPAPVVEVPAGNPMIPQPMEVARTPVRRTFLTEEGLEVIVLREGTSDRQVREGDVIKVSYEETVSGQHQRLDPTKTGREPLVFEVGSDKVVDGWNLGVIGMRENEIRKISIPSSLAYGPDGNGELGVPSNANLELRITVIRID